MSEQTKIALFEELTSAELEVISGGKRKKRVKIDNSINQGDVAVGGSGGGGGVQGGDGGDATSK
jgi:hypothetical protein